MYLSPKSILILNVALLREALVILHDCSFSHLAKNRRGVKSSSLMLSSIEVCEKDDNDIAVLLCRLQSISDSSKLLLPCDFRSGAVMGASIAFVSSACRRGSCSNYHFHSCLQSLRKYLLAYYQHVFFQGNSHPSAHVARPLQLILLLDRKNLLLRSLFLYWLHEDSG